MTNKTIAAIATGLTNAGISIIRISGPESFSVISKIFVTPKGEFNASAEESHTVHYGHIVKGSEVADEVLVLLFKGPRSYTAEDVVEIHCHGGVIVTRKILDIVLYAGARIAEPGEFTKRAFLNGRIDLSKAEAVIDIINAKNTMALKNSVKQLGGAESGEIGKIREQIIHDTAFIEAALDDPEHYSLEGFSEELSERVKKSREDVDRLLRSADNGRLISEGIVTAIVGKPNAGKSTLLNAIMGEERAIVTDIAGTTRDTLEETVSFGGITLNIIDTAGIRETGDVIEQIGVERAFHAADDADLILFVIDRTRALDDNDRKIIEKIKDKKVIILANKSDVSSAAPCEELIAGSPVIEISAKKGAGLEELSDTIKAMFFGGEISANDEVLITSERHKECLKDAYASLSAVLQSVEDGMSEDFYTIDLMNAYSSLGQIIGEETDEDLINRIFKDFCMGK